MNIWSAWWGCVLLACLTAGAFQPERTPWYRYLSKELASAVAAGKQLQEPGSQTAESRYYEEDYWYGRARERGGYYPLQERHSPLEERHYQPAKPHCHPQTITKFNTIYKDRRANVFNKVEIRNPRPQVHKTRETRHTTIRYPVFITQVIKPLLTQVETKVKPLFFTKTLKRIKTIVFTVTGIGQVTVTSVKYEREYVTRCNKKHKGHGGGGGYRGHGGGYHRREDHFDPEYIDVDYVSTPTYVTDRLDSYDEIYSSRGSSSRFSGRYKRAIDLTPSMADVQSDSTHTHITNPLPLA